MTPTAAQIADLLEGAASHIAEHGWTVGEFNTDSGDLMACETCARGALAAAAGRPPAFAARTVFTTWRADGRGSAADLDAIDLISAADEALGGYLVREGLAERGGRSGLWEVVEEWNDADGRTAEQVIAALRECAADLRKGEAA